MRTSLKKAVTSTARASSCDASFRSTMSELNPQILGSMRWTIDTKKSQGSILVDSGGKSYLDTFMQISSIPLGYNNEDMKQALRDEDTLSYIVSRPATGMFPPADLPKLLHEPLRIAPAGMKYIQTLMCGSCTVENALKAAFGFYAYRARGGEAPGPEAHASCMDGQKPGSPEVTALSFRGCFHGRTFGALSMTNSKSAIKVDMPAFQWPHAPFPELKYPLHENERENAEEEARCLAIAEELIVEYNKAGKPVAACIIEPIQGEGGDRHASDDFFRKLTAMVKSHGATMIVDEVQTGFGASGKWWASDYWGTEADIVCYAKKSQACGFFYTSPYATNPDTRIFNTWMGEPLKLVMMNTAIQVVERDNLLDNVNRVGKVLLDGFDQLAKDTDGKVSAGRGRGLYAAFDLDTPARRDAVVKNAFESGLLIGASGAKSIRFRPSLNFTEAQANQTLDILGKVIKDC